ncbi:hypothetical protein [Halocatena marina]|uniref:hypothetical protein n=1 Tax=Halocatena marina TaxID=2934937 RepID=UPI00200F938B|nr:hypothetical protein [Halocatena marina]
MPSPNRKGWGISGGSHGDDMDSDGASLTGPQPYEGDKREFPRCVAGSLRVRVGTEGLRQSESDGRIPVLQAREEVNSQASVAKEALLSANRSSSHNNGAFSSNSAATRFRKFTKRRQISSTVSSSCLWAWANGLDYKPTDARI